MADGIQRNPHADFARVDAARPPWDDGSRFRYTRTADPGWRFGDGANRLRRPPPPAGHVAIDPYAPGRAGSSNYTLLTSAVAPRPIALISTRAADADGGAANLAPFSYFNLVGHDPPLFVVGFVGAAAKDTLRNVLATREAVINLVGEPLLEAANAAAADAPAGLSEWRLAGLTPRHDCHTVRCARVAEAVFSVEVRVDAVREYASRRPGAGAEPTGTLVVFEGTRIWVRDDAVNEARDRVDPAVLRPVSRLGGITYARTTEAVELPRPSFRHDVGGREGFDKLPPEKEA